MKLQLKCPLIICSLIRIQITCFVCKTYASTTRQLLHPQQTVAALIRYIASRNNSSLTTMPVGYPTMASSSSRLSTISSTIAAPQCHRPIMPAQSQRILIIYSTSCTTISSNSRRVEAFRLIFHQDISSAIAQRIR